MLIICSLHENKSDVKQTKVRHKTDINAQIMNKKKNQYNAQQPKLFLIRKS